MTDVNIDDVYEELKYFGELPETSRLIKDYLTLRDENAKLRALVKELADALDSEARVKCALCDMRGRSKVCHELKGFCSVCDINTLVARAREVVK